jgi:hypothetical protein
MTCIVLVQNPNGGGVLAITDDDQNIMRYDTAEEAERDTKDQPLVRAWGGFVVDLDSLEVTEV